MSRPTEKLQQEELEKARELQHWIRRYAQNRSLPTMVSLAVFVLLFLAISVPSYWGGAAYRAGNVPGFVLCMLVLIAAMLATIYLSVPRWGGRRLQRMAEGLYAREGGVTIYPTGVSRPWLIAVIGGLFGICVVGHVVLSVLGYMPDGRYQQPISALYAVPFLVALNYFMWPAAGYIGLLWPLLYALHAVLNVAGAPIVFTGRWEILNMLLPTAGYGFLTSLVAHAYSRWALHKARGIIVRQSDRAGVVQDGDRA